MKNIIKIKFITFILMFISINVYSANAITFPANCGVNKYSCDDGTAVDLGENSTAWTWNCRSISSQKNCSKTKPTPENADYKTASGYIANHCANGTYNAGLNKCVEVVGSILTTTPSYAWNCSSGRMTENCQSNPPAYAITDPTPPVPPVTPPIITIDPPICSSTSQNSCSKGSASNFTETATVWNWRCSNAVNETVNCSKNKPITPVTNGVCGTTRNTCSSGSVSNTGFNGSRYYWNCDGSNGGTTVYCSAPENVVTPTFCAAKTGAQVATIIGSPNPFENLAQGNIGAVVKVQGRCPYQDTVCINNGWDKRTATMTCQSSGNWTGSLDPVAPPVSNLKYKIECVNHPTQSNLSICGESAQLAYDHPQRPFGFTPDTEDKQGQTCTTAGSIFTAKINYRVGYYSSLPSTATFKCQ